MFSRKTAGGLTVIALAAALAGCGSSVGNHVQPGQAGKTEAPAADKAESLYKMNCVSCHGTDLQGKIGPNLQQVGARLSKEQIAAKITNGGGGMVAFKGSLDAGEIQKLAEWLAKKK